MIGWLDGGAGASGDMLLGALADAGVPLEVMQAAVTAVAPGVELAAEPVERSGLGALRVHVRVEGLPVAPRGWREVRAVLEAAPLAEPVRALALRAFALLAEAEAAVHRVPADDVHFHEVGALDALADVVGAAAGLVHFGLTRLSCSTLSVGSGTARGAHGPLPVPAPAVLQLLGGVPVQAGPAAHEATTPTGAAVLRAAVDAWEPLPPMTVVRTGVGAGGRDRPEVANALRLVLGEPAASPEQVVVVEATVDDLDPRVWPAVLDALLAAGAVDAWHAPVLMKKGRPGAVLTALAPPGALDAVAAAVLRETTTIGLRWWPAARRVLDRTWETVDVDGQPVRVKVSTDPSAGGVRTATPEWEDVAAAAAALGRPVREVLARAAAVSARPPA
ncbi:MAG TPA: nickel pincer cofactor biosynthesis protein LarC [Mycobacteriales bacterium]|nr:nickel pincer cofactor biosynthesis protein LarC [Mycobacteriales bacterium]